VAGFTSGNYAAVTGLAYDSINKKLGLKVGADTVIPFSSGLKGWTALGNCSTAKTFVVDVDAPYILIVAYKYKDTYATGWWIGMYFSTGVAGMRDVKSPDWKQDSGYAPAAVSLSPSSDGKTWTLGGNSHYGNGYAIALPVGDFIWA